MPLGYDFSPTEGAIMPLVYDFSPTGGGVMKGAAGFSMACPFFIGAKCCLKYRGDGEQTSTTARSPGLMTQIFSRSPAGRDRPTGADSSLCNKPGSSSTLKRLVCASGGRRTMANPMLQHYSKHDAAYRLLSVAI